MTGRKLCASRAEQWQHAPSSAIADRRGYLSWDVDHAGWLVFFHHPDEETFYGRKLEEAMAWGLVCFMAAKIGIGQFLL